jgi:hypothetical protein
MCFGQSVIPTTATREDHIVKWPLKTGVEPEETAVARKRLRRKERKTPSLDGQEEGTRVEAASDTSTVTPRLPGHDGKGTQFRACNCITLGLGTCTRDRPYLGGSHKSRETLTKECAGVSQQHCNDRLVFSSERASHINKSVMV